MLRKEIKKGKNTHSVTGIFKKLNQHDWKQTDFLFLIKISP